MSGKNSWKTLLDYRALLGALTKSCMRCKCGMPLSMDEDREVSSHYSLFNLFGCSVAFIAFYGICFLYICHLGNLGVEVTVCRY